MSRHDYCYSLTWAAVQMGLIRPGWYCENKECGALLTSLHKHHEDYDKPLEIIYLCPKCHRKRHFELGKVKNQEFFESCRKANEREAADKIKNEIND